MKIAGGTKILFKGEVGQVLFFDKRENKYLVNIDSKCYCELLSVDEFDLL